MSSVFFVPYTHSVDEAEQTWRIACEHIGIPVTSKKVNSLQWKHNGKIYSVKIGEVMPSYFDPSEGEVLIIADADSVLLACSSGRGIRSGQPVMIGKDRVIEIDYFD